jgi:hypothetical protein
MLARQGETTRRALVHYVTLLTTWRRRGPLGLWLKSMWWEGHTSMSDIQYPAFVSRDTACVLCAVLGPLVYSLYPVPLAYGRSHVIWKICTMKRGMQL